MTVAKRAHPGSNQGPADLQSAALPLSYIPHVIFCNSQSYRSSHFTQKSKKPVSCGVRTHAQKPVVDLKSTPLDHSGKLTLAKKERRDSKETQQEQKTKICSHAGLNRGPYGY